MATYYSDQMTKYHAIPRQNVKSNELGGRIRNAFFDYLVDGTENHDDIIYLCRLPAGARILEGWVMWENVGDATSELDIGTIADPDRYTVDAALATAAAGDDLFAQTITNHFGDELTAETDIVATLVTSDFDAAGIIRGHIWYVVD